MLSLYDNQHILARHSIWPVPCPRRQSASIKTLRWTNSLYVAQPPSELLLWLNLIWEIHCSTQREKKRGREREKEKSTWNRLFQWSWFSSNYWSKAAGGKKDGQSCQKEERDDALLSIRNKMLSWLYNLSIFDGTVISHTNICTPYSIWATQKA